VKIEHEPLVDLAKLGFCSKLQHATICEAYGHQTATSDMNDWEVQHFAEYQSSEGA